MSFELAFKDRLRDNIPEAEADIYPQKLPEDRNNEHRPAITWQVSTSRRFPTTDGTSSVWPKTMQVICWGITYLAMLELKEKVIALFDDYYGPAGDYYIDGSLIEAEIDGFEPDTQLHLNTLFIQLWHRKNE